MSNFNSSTSANNTKKSNKKIITIIIVLVLVVAAAAAYFVTANAKGMWPFAANSAQESDPAEPTGTPSSVVEITNTDVKKDKDMQVVTVGVKLNTEEKGHCVLTFTNEAKNVSIVLDESKAKKPKTEDGKTVELENCKGWSFGAADLPTGEYDAEVKFVGSENSAIASKKVTLK